MRVVNAKPMEIAVRNIIRQLAVRAAVAALALAGSSAASAQESFPSRPIRIVVPYAPGGVADTFSRAVGKHLQDALGQPVVVENKPGGSQIIGAMAVAGAPADGHTLLLGSTTSLAVNVYTQKSIRYDPVRDFAPVSLGMTMPLFLVVNPSIPAASVKELIALLKDAPGKYSYASIGNGSSTHMAAEMFMMLTGTKMIHVPYKSSMPAITDVVGGQVAINFDVGSTSLPLVREGKLRVLGVGSRDRVSMMPALPTIAEAGVPDYDASVWFGFVAPARTPQAVVDKLSAEIKRILELPEMRTKFASFAVELTPTSPEQFGSMIKNEIVRWTRVLRAAGIEPE